MRSFTEQAQRYAQCHGNRITLYTHVVGITLILFALTILLGFVHIVVLNVMDIKLSILAVAALLIYYFSLNWLLALVLTPLFIVLLWLASFFDHAGPTPFALWAFVIVFALGCLFQLIGHLIQGSRPAVAVNFWDAFASPLFITAELFFMAGKMQRLKNKIYVKKDTLPGEENTLKSETDKT